MLRMLYVVYILYTYIYVTARLYIKGICEVTEAFKEFMKSLKCLGPGLGV